MRPQHEPPSVSPRRAHGLLGTSVAFLALGVVALWSVTELVQVRAERSQPRRQARLAQAHPVQLERARVQEAPRSPEPRRAPTVEQPVDASTDASTGETPAEDGTQDLIPILDTVFAQETSAGERHYRSLRSVLGDTSVGVINLWATYCAPCKEEFARFREVAAEDRWGSDVRFVPILMDGKKAKRAHGMRDSMPQTNSFLIDERLIASALRDGGFVPTNEDELALPMTLVVDCRRQLHYFHPKAIGGDEIEVFRSAVMAARKVNERCRERRQTNELADPERPTPKSPRRPTRQLCKPGERFVRNACRKNDANEIFVFRK